MELRNTLENEPIRSSLMRGLRVSSIGTGSCFRRSLVGKEGPCLWSQPFSRSAEMSSKAQGGVRWGEGAIAGMAGRDAVLSSSEFFDRGRGRAA